MTKRKAETSWKPKLARGSLRYQAIVDALKRDIANGNLEPGARLPTQRNLAGQLDVALGTVTRAYAEAERRGLIDVQGARGTFIAGRQGHDLPNVDELGIPDPSSSMVEMSVDLPIHSEDPPLGPVLHELSRSKHLSEMLRYHEVAGISRHCTAGVKWIDRFGFSVSHDDVVICSGSQHALTVSLMSFAQPGDLVLCDELTYPGMRSIASHLHLRLEGVPFDSGGMLPKKIEQRCKQEKVAAVYCIPSFHNPTTAQIDLGRRKTLAKLAQKYDFAILEDDVHRLTSDTPPPPIATMAPDHTYFIASLSKSVAAGLRIAYLVPPGSAKDSVSQAVWASVWMVPTLMAEIASIWIEDGTADDVVRRKTSEAKKRQKIFSEILGHLSHQTQPSGYYAWLQLPAPWSSTEFALEARRRGVAVTPSQPFLVGSIPPPAAVRICLAAAETRESMRNGLHTLNEMLQQDPGGGRPVF